ncbi:hypothetical protein ACTFIU_011549 [Dictyostelium citrinum]
MKNNTKIIETKCSLEQINVSPKYYDIISFGYFPNYFNNNNNSTIVENNIKEYKISILENDNQTNKLCTTITNNIKIIKKISKSKKLNSKSHIFKKRNFKSNNCSSSSSNQNTNNVIATLILPKINDNQIENQSTNDQSINCIYNNNNNNKKSNENNNKNKFTWVYYHYDCNGKRKSIYDDNEISELSTTTAFPDNHICSKCHSNQRSVFKLNKFGELDCSFCLNLINNNNNTDFN